MNEKKDMCINRESNAGPIDIILATMDFTTKPLMPF